MRESIAGMLVVTTWDKEDIPEIERYGIPYTLNENKEAVIDGIVVGDDPAKGIGVAAIETGTELFCVYPDAPKAGWDETVAILKRGFIHSKEFTELGIKHQGYCGTDPRCPYK